MRIVKAARYDQEILQDYEAEHCGYPGYNIGLQYLHEANTRCKAKWSLVVISATEIANILLPPHNHPIEVIPPSGLSVLAAVRRLKELSKQQMPECWERISKIGQRDFSLMRVALQFEKGALKHVDGVHRLLAYGLFGGDQELSAYVAGL